jgi:hypothetical protein
MCSKFFCKQKELVTIMASTNATDNFIQPMATFKGKEYRSEIADDFPNAMFVAKTCCDWLCKKKKSFHDHVTLCSGTQNCRTLSLALRRPWLKVKSCRVWNFFE